MLDDDKQLRQTAISLPVCRAAPSARFNCSELAMRDSQQPLAGPRELFAGLSKRLDDARSLIDNAVPRARCGSVLQAALHAPWPANQRRMERIRPSSCMICMHVTCCAVRCTHSQAMPFGCIGHAIPSNCYCDNTNMSLCIHRSLPAFAAGPLRLPTLPPRPRQRSAAPEQSQQQQRASSTVVVRGGRFAALIPGDGVIETVFTSGLGNFL